MGAQAGLNLAAELAGHEPKPLDFGYFARFISLGRGNGLTQFVDRGDRPLARVVSGRRAAASRRPDRPGDGDPAPSRERPSARRRWRPPSTGFSSSGLLVTLNQRCPI